MRWRRLRGVCVFMRDSDNKRELDALVKEAEKNRVELQKTWKKVGDLDAAIQSAQRAHSEVKVKRKEK